MAQYICLTDSDGNVQLQAPATSAGLRLVARAVLPKVARERRSNKLSRTLVLYSYAYTNGHWTNGAACDTSLVERGLVRLCADMGKEEAACLTPKARVIYDAIMATYIA